MKIILEHFPMMAQLNDLTRNNRLVKRIRLLYITLTLTRYGSLQQRQKNVVQPDYVEILLRYDRTFLDSGRVLLYYALLLLLSNPPRSLGFMRAMLSIFL